MYEERRSFAPVKVGDEIDVKIESVGQKGDGIAKVSGFVIFVPNTKEGDEVKIKISRVLRKVGFGDVVGSGGSSSEGSAEAPQEAEPEDTENFGEEENKEE